LILLKALPRFQHRCRFAEIMEPAQTLSMNVTEYKKVSFEADSTEKRLIVVLESAFLETVKVKDRYQLLNVDDHQGLLRRAHRPVENARPDVLHQTLMALLDSPLNKVGMLQVFITTHKGDLIRVHPSVRIPRTFKRFCGLMVQLLHKHVIRSVDGPEKLFEMIPNPVLKHLPVGSHIVGFTRTADKLQSADQFVAQSLARVAAEADARTAAIAAANEGTVVSPEPPAQLVFVIGAFAHGKFDGSYVDEWISVSEFPLSAAAVASRVCTAFERQWNIV
jgi:rRNA small subunit pseudouridine methyltransferase Nep1